MREFGVGGRSVENELVLVIASVIGVRHPRFQKLGDGPGIFAGQISADYNGMSIGPMDVSMGKDMQQEVTQSPTDSFERLKEVNQPLAVCWYLSAVCWCFAAASDNSNHTVVNREAKHYVEAKHRLLPGSQASNGPQFL
ncbi:hypothetical protein B0H14DRAFT_2572778 [Mycena olivaceomarginata]|nr:hypothetical protein B0H14DRAFT_2572778 [Mycena olivaceomarginata]